MRRLLLLVFLALPLSAADLKVEDVAWIAGHWTATDTEEVWLAPRGGLMTGMSRTVKNGRASFEFIRIQETKDGVFYFAQPGGRPAVAFRLVEATPTRAMFANPEHDFPQRITYALRDGQLCA
ncbi:MAG TPA: DUF6265 family protein, partial [Thermoanaerobaculia bacterium]|nr:DUF6265 family protein [Thermoanaerobaculia bacterium]